MGANPYETKPWEKIEGLYEVKFTNGDELWVDVIANVINGQAIPLYLVSKDNIMYNWMNILSIQKKMHK